MADEPRQYFALFRVASDTPKDRAQTTMLTAMGLVDRWSDRNHEAVFHAEAGYVFGQLLETRKSAEAMQKQFRNTAGIGSGDSMLIFEIGDDYGGAGFSRAWTWLQHRPSR